MLRSPNFLRTLAPLLALLALTALPAAADWQTGVTAFRGGDYTTAAQNFQHVVDLQPDWPGGHLMLGRSLLALNRKQDAVAHLSRAHELKPDDGTTVLTLGRTYLELGQANQAATILGKVDARSLPEANRGTLYQLRGQALLQAGHPSEALSDLAHAVRLEPDNAKLQRTYGSLELRHGDLERALPALQRSAELDPDDADAQRLYLSALVRDARQAPETGKAAAYSRAAAVGEGLARLDASGETLSLLGNLQLQAGREDAAFSTFGKAAEADPAAWEPAFYRGQILLGRQDYRTAESELKRAQGLAPADSQTRIWRQLGSIYEKLPEPDYFDEAKEAYTQAGDTDALARVEKNEQIFRDNARLDAEERRQRVEQACRQEITAELNRGAIPPSMEDCMARKGAG